MSPSRVLITGWLACVFVLCAASARADAQLDVSEIVLKNTSKVTFTVTPSVTPVGDAQLQNALTVHTERKRFVVRIPTAVIPWWHTRQSFVYTFVVDDTQTHQRYVFDVLATPAGSFEEQYAPVPFTVLGDSEPEKGVASLPIASLRPERATVIFDGPTQRTLAFWGPQILSLQVQNTSNLFPVTVQLDPIDSVEVGDSFFEGAGQIVKPSNTTLTIRPKESVTLTVAVKPKWSSALKQLISPVTQTDQANITIKFDHQVGPFGGERGTWFSEPVAVRFQPTLFDLAAALILGVLLGLTFRLLNGLTRPEGVSRQPSLMRKAATVLEVVGVALVGAVALEVIALLISLTGSRLVLFGLDIDPNALLPTLFIGGTAGVLGKQLGEKASEFASTATLFGKKPATD